MEAPAAPAPPAQRAVLDEAHIHPDVRGKIARLHADIVQEVRAAAAAHAVVVVGMRFNQPGRKARATLREAGVAFHYLEYGGYLGPWRRRNALKMWTGWPTFPMVFVKGILVGGASELRRLVERGELRRMLSA